MEVLVVAGTLAAAFFLMWRHALAQRDDARSELAALQGRIEKLIEEMEEFRG